MTFASGKVDFIYTYVHTPGPARPIFFFFFVVWAELWCCYILYSLVIGEKRNLWWWGRADYGLTMGWLAGWHCWLGLTLDSLSLSLVFSFPVCVCLSSVYYPHRGFDHAGTNKRRRQTQKLKGRSNEKEPSWEFIDRSERIQARKKVSTLKIIGNCCCCSALQFRFFSLAWKRWKGINQDGTGPAMPSNPVYK